VLKKKEVLARVLLIISMTCFFLLSFAPFSNFLVWRLEKSYPPLMEYANLKGLKYIVILTAWDSDNPTVPYTSNLGYSSTLRMLEAHRIYMGLLQCKIVVSGSEVGGKLMTMCLELLSVPEKNIMIDVSENTWKSAVNLKHILGGEKFVLVTSAVHLPRSMRSFLREGLRPIPAPADFLYGYYRNYKFSFPRPLTYYIPNTDSFMRSSAALYEYMGLAWYYIQALYKN
jgi:uncharacterized SAM-binding protein YcdF (DUF218 family)